MSRGMKIDLLHLKGWLLNIFLSSVVLYLHIYILTCFLVILHYHIVCGLTEFSFHEIQTVNFGIFFFSARNRTSINLVRALKNCRASEKRNENGNSFWLTRNFSRLLINCVLECRASSIFFFMKGNWEIYQIM